MKLYFFPKFHKADAIKLKTRFVCCFLGFCLFIVVGTIKPWLSCLMSPRLNEYFDGLMNLHGLNWMYIKGLN